MKHVLNAFFIKIIVQNLTYYLLDKLNKKCDHVNLKNNLFKVE